VIRFRVTGWQEMALRSARSRKKGIAPKRRLQPTGKVCPGLTCPGPGWEVCVPGTKGSAKAFVVGGKARIVNDSAKAAPWAELVRQEARRTTAHAEPLRGPVEVRITFFLPRPKSHYAKARGGGSYLRPTSPTFVTTTPDGDKLTRATWDALTGVLFADDSQIVRWSGEKRYADPEPVGAVIEVVPL